MSASPRSSLRLQGKEQNTSPQPGTVTIQRKKRQSSHASTSNPSPSKRRKISNEIGTDARSENTVSRPDGRVKGRRGHLQLMTEMPMDVLYEVLNSLEPVDLLHLSWSSKTLHSIIMGRSARYIWDHARIFLVSPPFAPLERSCRHMRFCIRPPILHLHVPQISTLPNTQNFYSINVVWSASPPVLTVFFNPYLTMPLSLHFFDIGMQLSTWLARRLASQVESMWQLSRRQQVRIHRYVV